MLICKVIGHIWATKKEDSLEGLKLMIVQETETNEKHGAVFVASDQIGAGIGEQVLVVTGSTARRAVGADDRAVDSAIVGIIDTVEVDREKAEKSEAAKASRKE